MNTRKGQKDMDATEHWKLLSDKIDAIAAKQDNLSALMLEIKQLKQENQRQAEKIVKLEKRVDDLEAYTRREDVVISGLRTRHKSYANAVKDDKEQVDENAPEKELASLEDQVVGFLEEKNIAIDKANKSACHLIGKGTKDYPPRIILRFANRKEKVRLLRQRRNLSDTPVFINEHLTHKNAQIAKHARKLRKEAKIKDTWTRNGVTFIRNSDSTIVKVDEAEVFGALGLTPLQMT